MTTESGSGTPFPPFHKWDRGYYLGFVVLGWLAIAFGFGPSFADRLQGKADYPAPLGLQVHIAAFMLLMALLTTQVMLIRGRRIALHRALGLTGFALVPVMLVTSYLAERHSQHFYVLKNPGNLNFFAVPLAYLVTFGVLAGAALALRRRAATHKRLIVLASTTILGVPYARWWGEALYQAFGDGFWGMIIHTYAGADLLVVLAIAYDLVTRGRVHPANLAGAAFLLLSQILVSVAYHSPAWPPVVRLLVGL